MAIISTNKGDYYSGQSISLEATKLFNESDKQQFSDICSNYNNLGISSSNLKDYNNAIKFYFKAVKFTNDTNDKLIALNNIGNGYREDKKYKQAIKIYKEILINFKTENHKIYSTALTNLAVSKWLENPLYNPESELIKALKIREKENDLWGQNSSHSHLTDYFINKNTEKALFHAHKMYEISKKIKSPTDRLQALNKVIQLDPKSYKESFNTYVKLEDSVQTARNNSKNQFALIRFDSEQLKKENVETQNSNLRQSIALGILVIVLVVLILIIMWYKKRQKTLKQEKQLEIKNNQLKMSKKVHDVVANGVYQIITEIENQEGLDKNRILYKLENVYEQSRDLSYENAKPSTGENFNERISNLLVSFQNENRKIFIVRNDHVIWEGLTGSTKEEIFHVIQELMINMKKHSEADQVVLRFERLENDIHIYYSDNGIGIAEEINPKNGMQNTVFRIQSIHGKIIFDKQTEKGLKVNISFPIS